MRPFFSLPLGLLLAGSALLSPDGRLAAAPASPAAKTVPAPAPSASSARKALAAAAPHGLPLTFEANRGQTDPTVRFLARTHHYNLFLTPTEAVFMTRTEGEQSKLQRFPAIPPPAVPSGVPGRTAVLRMRLLGADRSARMEAAGAQSGKINYLLGNDPRRWKTGIPAFAKVDAHNVYPGIDLVYYGSERRLEYDFRVAPHADPGAIRLSFEGALSARIAADGALLLRTSAGETCWHRPVIYQERHGKRTPVAGGYVLASHRPSGAKKGIEVTFRLAHYDRTHSLVIDPTLAYSSFLGGPGDDIAQGVALDSAGHLYITGSSYLPGFPTKNALQGTYGGGSDDAFVAKMDLSASGDASLLYCTYLGGSGTDVGAGIAVDSAGDAYVAGSTNSFNFPTFHAFRSTLNYNPGIGLGDAFVCKLSPDGSTLLYSTYFGGSSGNNAYGVAQDGVGNVYITGQTQSSDLPTTFGALRTAFIYGNSAFVAKFNTLGTGVSSLVYSTYLGDPTAVMGSDFGSRLAVDSAGNAYVVGYCQHSFPIINGFQATFGGVGSTYGDGFLAKLNATGTALLYSTFVGGSGDDYITDIAVNGTGVATVVGVTNSSNFPTRNALQPALDGGMDAFVTRIDTTAVGNASLIWSTYLGGSASDYARSVFLDAAGNIYVGGETFSDDFPFTPDHLPIAEGYAQVFVAKLLPDASAITYCTYMCGESSSQGGYVAADASGSIYLVGSTESRYFPTTSNAFQGAHASPTLSYNDVFAAKITLDCLDLALTQTANAHAVVIGNSVTYTLTVTNNGPFTATSTVLNDVLSNSHDPDSPFSFIVGATSTTQGTVSQTGNTLTFNIGTLASGATATATVMVVTNGSGFGTLTSAGTVGADQCDSNPANNTASTTVGVVHRVPVLIQISPNTVAAGSPTFTLTAQGTDFADGAQIRWNGVPLTTTYLSGTQLTAVVPNSLVAAAGSVPITVANPTPFGSVSNAAVLLVGAVALRATAAVSHDALGNVRVTLTLANSGTAPANGVVLTRAVLNGISPTAGLPATVGSIAAGGVQSVILTYPASVGATGLATTLLLNATYATGAYSGTLRVTLP